MAQRNTYFQDEEVTKKIDLKQLGRTLKYILPHKKILICDDAAFDRVRDIPFAAHHLKDHNR